MKEVIVSTLLFAARVVPIMALGMYLASYSMKKGLLRYLSGLMRPLASFSGFSDISLASIAACFVSPIAGYSILSQAYREGVVDEKEVLAASIADAFPSSFGMLYKLYLPFLIPALGTIGIAYVLLRMGGILLKSIVGFILARIWLKRDGSNDEREVEISLGGIENRDPLSFTIENLKSIVPRLLLVYFLVRLAISYGLMDRLSQALSFLAPYMNPNSLALAAIGIFDLRSAIVAAASMLEGGVVTGKWILAAFFLSAILGSLSYRSLRDYVPIYIPLYGKFGIKITILEATISILINSLILACILLLL